MTTVTLYYGSFMTLVSWLQDSTLHICKAARMQTDVWSDAALHGKSAYGAQRSKRKLRLILRSILDDRI